MSAFVLTPTVSYPLSLLLVILNTFGPATVTFDTLATSLLGIWSVAPLAVVLTLPRPQKSQIEG